MSFQSWLTWLSGVSRSTKKPGRRPASRRRKSFKPGVEALEDRKLLTANLGLSNPVALINFAPPSSLEGTALSLTSTVTDPGATITGYSWHVTRDGTAYAAGTHATFGFRPNDNGQYVVNLQVTDSAG